MEAVRRRVQSIGGGKLKQLLLLKTSRSFSNLEPQSNGTPGNRIILSPPLISIDLPDIWPSNSTYTSSSINRSTNSQTARVIDGKSIATEITSRIANEVSRMRESIGKFPGLAVILVGQRRDSQTYVRNKIKACEEAGIKYLMAELPDTCTQNEVCSALSRFNENPSVHGILVQLPLPQHLDEGKILDLVKLEKDVDGFHPMNIGNLAMRGREPLFIPCTPKEAPCNSEHFACIYKESRTDYP